MCVPVVFVAHLKVGRGVVVEMRKDIKLIEEKLSRFTEFQKEI